MKFFSKLFSGSKQDTHQSPKADLDDVVSAIKKAEDSENISPGKKIHNFEYGEAEVRFDRDIIHNGRISIFEGEKKLFSFTVFAKEGEYGILRSAFESVIDFLNGDQSIKNLPNNDILKGFYHHH